MSVSLKLESIGYYFRSREIYSCDALHKKDKYPVKKLSPSDKILSISYAVVVLSMVFLLRINRQGIYDTYIHTFMMSIIQVFFQ